MTGDDRIQNRDETDTATVSDSGPQQAVLAGPDAEELGDALQDRGVAISRIDGIADREALEAAGIGSADLFVLTDVGQATAIPVAVDAAGSAGSDDSLRVVVYARESLPEFAKGQADLLIDPELLAPETVAEELTR